ncbi:MAG: hypothetical protein ACYYK0_00825 [Candidatus Eutrophobiaceae bacterium]
MDRIVRQWVNAEFLSSGFSLFGDSVKQSGLRRDGLEAHVELKYLCGKI